MGMWNMKYKIEIILFYLFKMSIIIYPEKIRYFIADCYGMLFYYIVKSRRNITKKNLKIAFKDLSDEEINKLAKKVYKNVGRTFIEMLWMDKLEINIIGKENLDKALKKEKGIILLSLHLGNWELGGGSIAKSGYPVSAVAKRQKNLGFNKLINDMRFKFNLKIIQKGTSPKEMIRTLKNNKLLGLIADQYSKDTEVKFFDEKTGAIAGPAALALKMGSAVILTYAVRNKDNTHTLFIEEEIEIIKTGDNKKDIQLNTQNFINEMEKAIKRYPDQWFWQHKRWR